MIAFAGSDSAVDLVYGSFSNSPEVYAWQPLKASYEQQVKFCESIWMEPASLHSFSQKDAVALFDGLLGDNIKGGTFLGVIKDPSAGAQFENVNNRPCRNDANPERCDQSQLRWADGPWWPIWGKMYSQDRRSDSDSFVVFELNKDTSEAMDDDTPAINLWYSHRDEAIMCQTSSLL